MITRQAASGAVALGVKVGIALVQPIGKQPDRAEETIGKVIGKAMIAVIDIQNSARLEIDGADADASSGARLGGLEIHSGRTLRVRVPSLAPEDPSNRAGLRRSRESDFAGRFGAAIACNLVCPLLQLSGPDCQNQRSVRSHRTPYRAFRVDVADSVLASRNALKMTNLDRIPPRYDVRAGASKFEFMRFTRSKAV